MYKLGFVSEDAQFSKGRAVLHSVVCLVIVKENVRGRKVRVLVFQRETVIYLH